MKKIALIAFTENGFKQLDLLRNKLVSESFTAYDKSVSTLNEFVENAFKTQDAIIFISATGIAVRKIANLVKSKDEDPAVIVMDERANFVIPMLSGHLGGANELAAEIAEITGAIPVITTATDVNHKFAVDLFTKKNNCVILDISKIKEVSAKVLKGEKVGLVSDWKVTGKAPREVEIITRKEAKDYKVGICLSLGNTRQEDSPFEVTLNAVPKICTLGVGCRKETDSKVFEERVLEVLNSGGISIESVKKLRTIDIKKEERCILDFCNKYNLDFETYTASELMEVPGNFKSSEFVRKVTGADNVCERSAVKGSGGGKIILNKTGGSGVTVAVAIEDWECKF